jgi:hypothetical protein
MMSWKDGTLLVSCPLKEPAEKEYESPYWYAYLRNGIRTCGSSTDRTKGTSTVLTFTEVC